MDLFRLLKRSFVYFGRLHFVLFFCFYFHFITLLNGQGTGTRTRVDSSANCHDIHYTIPWLEIKPARVPGFEPGSNGPKPLMLSTTPYPLIWSSSDSRSLWQMHFKMKLQFATVAKKVTILSKYICSEATTMSTQPSVMSYLHGITIYPLQHSRSCYHVKSFWHFISKTAAKLVI